MRIKKSSCTVSYFTAFACILGISLHAQNVSLTASPTNADHLLITATPGATTVHPGDTVKFDMNIKNTGADEQKIDVRNMWWAVTDSSEIVIPGWPRLGGIGPVVTTKSTAIAPGASFQRPWTANVQQTASPGEVTLRVGVPLHFMSDEKTWSEPVKIQIVAKEPAANPLYATWKGQEGKTVTFNRTESISGGAPIPGNSGSRAVPSKSIQFTLAKFSTDQAEIKVITDGNQTAGTLVIPSKLMPDDPTLPKPNGTEELTIGGKTYTCAKYTYYTGSAAELGHESQGLRGHVTVWVAGGIPGGIVKRNIEHTVRVTYNITDTLAVGQ